MKILNCWSEITVNGDDNLLHRFCVNNSIKLTHFAKRKELMIVIRKYMYKIYQFYALTKHDLSVFRVNITQFVLCIDQTLSVFRVNITQLQNTIKYLYKE